MISKVGTKAHRQVLSRRLRTLPFYPTDRSSGDFASQLPPQSTVSRRPSRFIHYSIFQRQPKSLILSDSPAFSQFTTTRTLSTTTADKATDALLEVFRIPDPPKQSENAFERTAFAAYKKWMVERVVHDERNPKFRRLHSAQKPIPTEVAQAVIDYLLKDEPTVDTSRLKTLHELVTSGTADVSQRGALFAEVQQQEKAFMTEHNFSQFQMEMIEGALTKITTLCAGAADGAPVDIIWAKAKEGGFVRRSLVQCLLHVASTYGRISSGRRGPYAYLTRTTVLDFLSADDDESAGADDPVDTADEVAILQDVLYEATDRSLSLRVRLLVERGLATHAEELLDARSTEADLHLRSYFPLLRLYLELDDIDRAMSLLQKMQANPTVTMDAESYVTVIAELARRGRFRSTPGGLEVRGVSLCHKVIQDMTNDVLEIPMGLAKRLHNAVAEGFPESGLMRTSSLAPLPLEHERAPKDTVVASRVHVNFSTGFCERTGATLRLMNLSRDDMEGLPEDVIKLSDNGNSHVSTATPQKKRRSKERAGKVQPAQGLARFAEWLDKREGRPFTVFVDGPNIGYYMQNFHRGRFSFHQIQSVVNALEKMGENALVILPRRYTTDEFPMSLGGGTPGEPRLSGVQKLTPEEKKIRDNLRRRGKLYVVPAGHLDDYYTILASVSKQSTSSKGEDLMVSSGDPSGRWPGVRPLVVSNDRFRDHRLGLIDERKFRRWFSSCIVTYDFAGYVVEKKNIQAEISFSPANVFSREIQQNSDADGNTVWHFPLEDTADEWFCFRIPDSS